MDIHEHAALDQKLKAKYAIQKNLFQTIGSALNDLKVRINRLTSSKKLTNEEADNLYNAIEYSQRIILRSRENEIKTLYSKFVTKLKYKPSLHEIFEQIELVDSPTCPIAELKLDDNKINFNVRQKNKFGNWLTTPYSVSKNDLDTGKLSISVANNNNSLPFHKFITSYNSKNNNQNTSFTITQNAKGDIDSAKFYSEKIVPFVTILGFEFGEQKIVQNFDCPTRKRKTTSFRETASH